MKPGKIALKKKIALNIFSRFVKSQTKLHELTYLFWECTLRCNFNCFHCGSDCKKDMAVKDMPVEDFLKVTETIKKKYDPSKVMIVITGGEPLLRKDLEICGQKLSEQGFSWGIVSNGYGLNKKRLLSLISSGLRAMTLSIDGFEDNHNWLRRNNKSFNAVINALDLLVQVKNLNYDIVSCVNKKNIHELENLKEFLIIKNVKAWRLFTIAPIGRAKNHEELFLDNNELEYLMEFIKRSRIENKMDISFSCEAFTGKYEADVRDSFFFCRAGINIGSVLADGSISACPNIDKSFVQGNIYKDDFIDIWDNSFEKMRNRNWTKHADCAECNYFKYCLGNGLHHRNMSTNETYRCFANINSNS